MKRAVAAVILFFLFASILGLAEAAPKLPVTMPVNEIRPGMTGVALTVFQGVKPEKMELEVLGVLKNVNGPKGDIILVRLRGAKPEFTGVVAGMSGSPVYIDGKLVGALAFSIGLFAKEPIAGVTPIAEMLEINELDRSRPAPPAGAAAGVRSAANRVSTGGADAQIAELTSDSIINQLKPIETPLVFSGFDEETLQRFGPMFASAAGVRPVMGAGAVTGEPQPEPLEPGSAVSAVLVSGDMSIAATCTVTYVDPERLLACGHPILQFGSVDLPMNKANVVATLASSYYAFKIVNATEPAGAFVQDRKSGILGRFGREPEMIPVTLTVHGGTRPKQYHYQVLNAPKLTPIAMMATVYQALRGVNDYGEDTTYRMQGKISVDGYPEVGLQNMFAPLDGGLPTGFGVAISIGERFGRIFDNPYNTPRIRGVELDFDLVKERRTARLESARTDLTEARPGDELVIETVLRPYRGEPLVRQIPVRVPTSTPKGPLRILISDGATLDGMRRMGPSLGSRMDLRSVIAMLNKEHANHRLYVSLLQSNPQAMVEDKVMPALPFSVMNVMEGLRGTQDMIVMGESAVFESSTPVDYVVSGAKVLTVNVK